MIQEGSFTSIREQVVDRVELDLTGLHIRPGLINAHDHLGFALFPRLGCGPYSNASEWARDVYQPYIAPVRDHLLVPKSLRLLWGGLRNLLSGVTTVNHHDPYEELFNEDFPVRVVRAFGWAHSLAFAPDVAAAFAATPANEPFLIHAAEGTDEPAEAELHQLDELGVLTERTVLIHGVAISESGWQLVKRRGCSIIWCPRSNLFTLGRTLNLNRIPSGIDIALGTDSPLTAEGDLLDEMCLARCLLDGDAERVQVLVASTARRILRLPPRPDDWIAIPEIGHPPELVVIRGRIQLISPRLAKGLPPAFTLHFSRLQVAGRPSVFVRWNISDLLAETRRYFDSPIHLSGREVLA